MEGWLSGENVQCTFVVPTNRKVLDERHFRPQINKVNFLDIKFLQLYIMEGWLSGRKRRS